MHANKLVRRLAGLPKSVVMTGWRLNEPDGGDGVALGCVGGVRGSVNEASDPALAGFGTAVRGRAHLVIGVRARVGVRLRCGICSRVAPGYDQGGGLRSWRHIELGFATCALVGPAVRVRCAEHGVVVARVPWARHDAPFTRAFDDVVVNMAVKASKQATADRYDTSWRAVNFACTRVADEALARVDLLAGLKAIAIDEVKYKKGHRYLTVVCDHGTGRVVWVKKGRSKKTLEAFFAALGEARSAALEIITCDGASWIHDVVKLKAPTAVVCLDTFHVISWATKALDQVRREEWNRLRRGGHAHAAKALKGMRWLLVRNWANLSGNQKAAVRELHATNQRLGRAWELKEELAELFKTGWVHLEHALNEWLAWASRSKLEPFVKLARTIRHFRTTIEATIEYGYTNGLAESNNAAIGRIRSNARGFHDPEAFIKMIMLDRAGLTPPLPWVTAA